MSNYRSQRLLETFGLLQFVNHEFLPENVDIIDLSDFNIVAGILDQQISWDFNHGHYNTVMALLDTVRLLSKNYQQYIDLIIADLSELYIYNISATIQRPAEFVPEMVTELRQHILALRLTPEIITDYLKRIIANFPPNPSFSSDDFIKDILRLLDQKNISLSSF